MGDHRVHVKIDFAAHGKNYTMDASINWFPDDFTGVDQRVMDFFRESWDDARARYDDQMAEYWEQEHAADLERSERAELSRLKAKYEGV